MAHVTDLALKSAIHGSTPTVAAVFLSVIRGEQDGLRDFLETALRAGGGWGHHRVRTVTETGDFPGRASGRENPLEGMVLPQGQG